MWINLSPITSIHLVAALTTPLNVHSLLAITSELLSITS